MPQKETDMPTMLRVESLVSFGRTASSGPMSRVVSALKRPPERRAHEIAQSRFHVAIIVTYPPRVAAAALPVPETTAAAVSTLYHAP